PIAIGCSLAVVGLWLMAGLDPTSSYGADVLPTLILTGLGLGLAFVPVIGLGTGDAEERDGGLASGLMTTAQQIGGAIGIAALIAVATERTTNALHSGAHLSSALTDGFQAAFHIEAGIIATGALLALVLLRRRAEPDGAVAGGEVVSPNVAVSSR